MDIKVVYEESGENSYQTPIWMLIQNFTIDWDTTIYIDIDSPFEALAYEDVDLEIMTLSVPNHIYVLSKTHPLKLGIHLPTLQNYANEMYGGIELGGIQRLLLRISDIEDTLQYSVKSLSIERTEY